MDIKQDELTDANSETEKTVFARTNPLTLEDLRGMNEDPSTPKCSKMLADINAKTANLDAAARKLKAGPEENVYGLTP
jgi:hypothetical protein